MVSVRTNGIIGNTNGYPDSTFATRSLSHHLHNPRLIGVADGESFACRIIAVGINQRGHYANSLASSFAALQGQINQRTVINQSGCISHFFASTVGGFANAHLILINIANNVVSFGGFGNFTEILTTVPIVNLAHCTFGMFAGRKMT